MRKISTDDLLKKCGFWLASRYIFFLQHKETLDHIFSTCPLARWVWNTILLKLELNQIGFSNSRDITQFFVKKSKGKGLSSVIIKVASFTGIYLWQERNKCIFVDIVCSKMNLTKKVKQANNLNLYNRGIKERDSLKNRKIADISDIPFCT